MGDGGEDLGAVANDATLQRNERFDAAAPCPGDPTVQCLAGLVGGQFEDRAQAFLEQVGAVEPWVGLAIHASFTRWRSVRFSGFFHSAYRARRSASAGPVDTVERRPWAHP